jgi:hypothetical protein
MPKTYDPTQDPDTIAWLVQLWHYGSIGTTDKPELHHARLKCALLDQLARVEQAEGSEIKRYFLAKNGLRLLVEKDALPDPAEHFTFGREVLANAAKLVALDDGWPLHDLGIRLQLPHPWLAIVDLERISRGDTYDNRVHARSRYALVAAKGALEEFFRGNKATGRRFAKELRAELDKLLAKPITPEQQQAWSRAMFWLAPQYRESLPDTPPEQKAGT